MSSSPPLLSLQTWALIRRYKLYLYRSPFTSIIRSVIWPGFLIGICVYILTTLDSNDGIVSKSGFAKLIPSITWLLTVFQVYHFVERLVTDRSSGIKSLMISMGLKRSAYYLGNSVCFMVLVMPVMITVSLISMIYIFDDSKSTKIEIIMIFILVVIHLIGIIFVLTSIITSDKFVSIVTIILLSESSLHLLIKHLMRTKNKTWRVVILFTASISPYESVRIFSESYILCKNCNQTKFDDNIVSQPTYLILVAMSFWTVFAFAFARWFDEVCPWQKDSATRRLLFCCETEPLILQEDSQIIDNPLRNSKFFERIVSNREVGIRIRNVTKKFGNIPVVSDITFNIYKGETTLLLGHNGAGKTTLMNMILGKLVPDKGKVMIQRANITGISRHESIGVCPQDSIMDANLTVREHLELFADIKTSGMSAQQRDSHINKILEDISLTDHSHKKPSELSGGMKRKLSLGMSFVGNSNVLILDEPSSGLDPDSRISVWKTIRQYRTDRTVLLSTQHMEEANYLGDRIAIMGAGRIVCCGSSTFLNDMFGNGYKLRVECPTSKTNDVLNFVRKYFAHAKLNEFDQIATQKATNQDPLQDIVIELVGDKWEDLERNLILLLEEIERDGDQLHVRSHGLKSSSIEDVMLNTSKMLSTEANDLRRPSINSTTSLISTMTNLSRRAELGSTASQLVYFNAMIVKHIHTFKRDWMSFVFYRLIVAIASAWSTIQSIDPLTAMFQPNLSTAFMVFHFVYYPTSEQVSKFKTMQLTSCANFVVYWLAQLIFDFIWIIVFTIAMNIFFETSFTGTFVSSAVVIHQIVTYSGLLFGISGALFAYILSRVLKSDKTAMGIYILLCVASSLEYALYQILKFVVSWDFEQLHSILQKIFIVLLPTDTIQYIFTGLVIECYVDSPISVCDPRLTRPAPVTTGLCLIVGQVIIYSIALYFIELTNIDLNWYLKLRNIFSFTHKNLRPNEPGVLDKDVVDESTKAIRLINDVSDEHYSLIAANLDKSYYKGDKVVDHLSFTVNKGECFGLLGVNGAGKSTTFSMISAEAKPDRGRIWMNGQYNNGDIDKYRNQLGYDPQSTPETSLSPTEALYLMARLRQLDERSIPTVVNSVLEILDMSQHCLKNSKNLSGGTKRKLALGMSLIGNPALLALDEPTAGVDPIARRGIWQLLRSLRMQNGASIVISSHAMEECEAICDRIAIMARGRLRCIGTFLHLRNKFAKGCSIRVQFSLGEGSASATPTTVLISELDSRLKREIGNAVQLVDQNVNSATFDVTDNNVKRSSLFKILRDFRQKHANISYMLNDASLEDIFLKLAREQQQLEQQQQNHQRQPQQHALFSRV